MTSVTGLTKERMLAIEAASVVGGVVNESGHLILEKHDSSTVDAGEVVGPGATVGPSVPVNPKVGQIWYDTNNLLGLTDELAVKNPTTSVANWLAYGYGYDTGIIFSVAGGGVTCTWTTSATHLGGITLSGLTVGEQYLIKARVRVPAGSPNVRLTVGYRSSSAFASIKDADVTLLLPYTADYSSLPIGIETAVGSGTCVVKEFSIYKINQRGFPSYIWDGTSWVQTEHTGYKDQSLTTVNTYLDQGIAGIKTFVNNMKANGLLNVGGGTNPVIIAGSYAEAGRQPSAEFYKDNGAGGFSGIVVRGWIGSGAVQRNVGILLKMSSEADVNESGKGWELASVSAAAWANSPSFRLRNLKDGNDTFLVDSDTNKATFYKDLQAGGVGTFDQLLVNRAIDISNTNLNNLAVGGFYNGQNFTNAPGGDTGWWYIEQIVYSTIASGFAIQRATQLYTAVPKIYHRTKVNTAWNAWYRVDNYVTTPWTACTLQNNWVNYGAPYQAAQYRMVGDCVEMRGLVRNGTVNTVITTLPEGFRPPAALILSGVTNLRTSWNTGAASAGTAHTHPNTGPADAPTRLQINATGAIAESSGANGFVDLSAIRFSVTA